MTLDTIEPDRAELISLLQPYIDGELADDERELVAVQVAENPEYQAIVREQREVRALLRGLEREAAPAELRERVIAGLDAVDAEQGGRLAPIIGRIKAFGRGSMLMAPAAAAAVALFFVVRGGVLDDVDVAVDGTHVDGGLTAPLRAAKDSRGSEGHSAKPEEAGAGLAKPEAGALPVHVAAARSLPEGVSLVSDVPQPGPSSVLRYGDGAQRMIVDTQRAAGDDVPRGTRQVFRGHAYFLGRDAEGRAQVEFLLGPVHHSLVFEGRGRPTASLSAEEPDFADLLMVADALRSAHER
ncbi:hypothetical protein G6O69_18800 [Pseudenhygromyxa sp. WMMC2535]|uniref:anti-sigma factor family protein n=1 Tax=Pseudenhygromyxa sp. WMMC2535 TaxID=2712867 RepID=UPI001553930F|nr:hypothetical protein [Pseudenhygromyxa sp. WMMC2535]NVB39900.1 hypothetical protein [Pseudenhygromyxa sp. WMMC2535]